MFNSLVHKNQFYTSKFGPKNILQQNDWIWPENGHFSSGTKVHVVGNLEIPIIERIFFRTYKGVLEFQKLKKQECKTFHRGAIFYKSVAICS